MKPESQNLTAKQSLDIITSMIHEVNGKVRKNAFYFLFWGWIVMLANLGTYVLSVVGYPYPYIVWVITIPAWIVTMYRGYRESKKAGIATHLGSITKWLWTMYGICIFTFVAFSNVLNHQVNPLIITVSAIPTFVSGVMLRFKPFMFGGVAFWIFGIICFLTPHETQPLIGAVAILFGYLVPGYLLKNMKEQADV